jgi:hypothetical protein
MTMPPLLQLIIGKKPRLRRAPKDRSKEIILHMTVAKVLRERCLPEWRWSHFPSGEYRDPRTSAKLKSMGLQRGWPDFLIFPPSGQIHALELKRIGETLSPEQAEFRLHAVKHTTGRIRFATRWPKFRPS